MTTERLTPDRRRQMTRDALVTAATEAFAAKGYAGASLESIATAAGFTTGAIYSNFADKEDLLMAVLERNSETIVRSQVDAMEGARERVGFDHADDAAVAATRRIRFAIEEPHYEMLRAELRLHAMRNPTFAQRFRKFLDLETSRGVTTMVEQHALYGVRTTVPARDLAILTEAGSTALAERAILDPDNAEHYAELLVHIYLMPRQFYEPVPEADAEGDPEGGAANLDPA
jgi:AcrR family transcriptional regulator